MSAKSSEDNDQCSTPFLEGICREHKILIDEIAMRGGELLRIVSFPDNWIKYNRAAKVFQSFLRKCCNILKIKLLDLYITVTDVDSFRHHVDSVLTHLYVHKITESELKELKILFQQYEESEGLLGIGWYNIRIIHLENQVENLNKRLIELERERNLKFLNHGLHDTDKDEEK